MQTIRCPQCKSQYSLKRYSEDSYFQPRTCLACGFSWAPVRFPPSYLAKLQAQKQNETQRGDELIRITENKMEYDRWKARRIANGESV